MFLSNYDEAYDFIIKGILENVCISYITFEHPSKTYYMNNGHNVVNITLDGGNSSGIVVTTENGEILSNLIKDIKDFFFKRDNVKSCYFELSDEDKVIFRLKYC